ncbi:translocation/assembly module TamB domain-containing protein [Pseudomonas sp. RIT-PI-S]|uniref:translocation/assembly module TamB domain-containing protein n=1 Tax=Pseudomonas sp. RIT-PI-S TaxID=3035295 RepID=UPI0021D7E594|nr:translocation/assembly module TamB domain-containing protein [Pseudomonas sp. RIT-PI-S]
MTRRWRWALIVAGTLVGMLMALVGIITVGLGTERGSRWLLDHAPGVQAEGFEGRLGGSWQARQLSWADSSGLRISVQEPRLSWAPSCLLRLTLCVRQLAAGTVAIETGPATEAAPSTGPLQLPGLRLPIGLELGDVDVGEVRYGGQPLLTDVHLAGLWNASGLQVGTLRLAYAGMHLDLSGQVRPEGEWPLDAQLALALPSVDGRPWEVKGALKGDVAGTLELAARSSGYLEAALNGSLQPLAEHLPAKLQLHADSFVAEQALPTTLTLQGLRLRAEGDLQQGYAIQGDASLPGEQGAVALALRGKADANGAQLNELSLTADAQHRASVIGTLSWAGDLTAEANLDWQDFPWTSLYPQAEPPPVTARSLKALVRYGSGHYLGNLAGEFQGPAGPFSLTTPFSGDSTQLVLPQLQLVAGQGQVAGQLKLGFETYIQWAADLTLANVNPAYWLAALPGKLAGTVTSEGRVQGGVLSLDARLGITGQLRGQPARLQGAVHGGGARWQVAGLDVALGANHLTGSGSSDERLDAVFALDAPRLDQLWPGLAGTLKGRLKLAGSPARPQGDVQLDGQRLAWETSRLGSLAVLGRIDDRQQATLSLKGAGLNFADTDLGTFTGKGGGDLKHHNVQFNLDGPRLALALGVDGNWADGAWKGRLASGNVASSGQAWALQAPASLRRLADGTVELGAHCWRSGVASLCADDQRLAPDPRLRLRLRGFPMASLKPWLPPELGWEGTASADVQLDLGGVGTRGALSLDVSNGTLSLRQGEQQVRFPYGTLRVASKVEPRQVNTEVTFDGRGLGQLHLQASIDPFGPQKPLSGNFRLDGLDVALLRPLIEQAERVAGHLQGNGQLGGTLLDPRVDGAFSLTGGSVSAPDLPLSVEDLSLQARMNGSHLQLDGGWRSGAQGQGKVSGYLDWAGPLKLDLAVVATQLPVAVQPYAQVEAGADLHLTLIEQQLALSGQVTVPRGSITVRQLPPSTVKVSSDAIVVGREAPTRGQLGIKMDVNVDVGQDKLTFTGFGLQSDIAGHLHIGDDLDTRGSLELRNGRYRAYGQRLTLRRARLFFTGPVDQPYLDVEAIRQTGDVTAGIRLSGSAQQPTSEVFAEPAMSQEQALSWLILGRPLSTDGEDSNLLAQAALGLGLMGSASTTGKLAKSLGVQDFELDTEGSGNATSVVASGNLTDRLTLRYGVGVFEPASTVALRYALTRQLYLEAASGVASSLDLFYKKDF